MKKLTKRQQEILDFIESFLQKNSYPPTLRDIGKEFGINSTNGVKVTLTALDKKHYIKLHPGLSRGIELLNAPKAPPVENEIGYIPIIGKVNTGNHIFAPENIEGMLAFDDTFISTKKVFAFKVQNDSMKNAGILNGDYVLARRQGTAEPGETLVFIVGNEITVKKFDVKLNKAYLIPENENYQTKILDIASSEFQIVGKVVGLIRKY